jgi:hypothetical protein
VAPAAAELQRAIIISAAHAQSPALRIHADQGYDDQIQPPKRHGTSQRRGDEYPEHSAARLGAEGVEAYSRMAPVDDDGDEDADASPARRSYQCRRVRLPVETALAERAERMA